MTSTAFDGGRADYQASLNFLKWLRPHGEWNLVAIHTDSDQPLEGLTFHEGDDKRILTWLANVGKTRNIYYTLNRLSRNIANKPGRKDIREMEFLHVDLDPEKDENAVPRSSGGTWGKDAFWPTVCGEPFYFRFSARDSAGRQVEFDAPAIFVADVDDSCSPRRSPKSRAIVSDTRAYYDKLPESDPRRYRQLDLQTLALARPRKLGDTDVAGVQFSLYTEPQTGVPAPGWPSGRTSTLRG